jgi:polysaccharide biosynthesis transport protein
MQRSSMSDSQPSGAPIAPLGPSAYLPAYPPGTVMPGAMLPGVGARTWPTLSELLNALKRRAVLALFLGILIGMAGGAGAWLAMPSGKHEVRALIRMKPYTPVVGQAEAINSSDFDSFKATQLVLMKTRPLLHRVVTDPSIAKLQIIREDDDPTRTLEERVKFSWRSPEILAVYMSGDDPQPLARLIDKLLEFYLEDARSADNTQLGRRRQALEQNREVLKKQIEQVAEEHKRILALTGAANNPMVIAQQSALVNDRIRDLSKDLDLLKKNHLKLEISLGLESNKLKKLEDAPVNQADLEEAINTSGSRNPELQKKYTERAKAKESLAKVREFAAAESDVVTSKVREIEKIDQEIRGLIEVERPKLEAGIRARLKSIVQQNIENMLTEKTLVDGQIQSFEKDLKELNERVARLNDGAIKGIAMQDPIHLKAQMAKIENELAGLIGVTQSNERVTSVEEATVVLNQNLRQKILLSFAATLAGAAAVMLGIAFLEWRSRRIDNLDQVVNDLGLRVIGTIPAFPSKNSLRSGDAATNQNWRFVLNESVNSARTMLLHAAKTQNMQVLMVTSAMQGEGKTSLSSQLATSMATAGLRTLILDFDLRNPSIHKLFDAQLTPGSAEILCQEVDISDAVQPTTVPNLWLVPAGQCSNRVIAALAQGHPLDALFNRLRGQFDFIVVDCCPILPVADALLVGQHVDGVLLSLLQDISQLPKVQQAIDKLTQLNIPLLGAIVNGVKPDIQAYGYNYVKQLPA